MTQLASPAACFEDATLQIGKQQGPPKEKVGCLATHLGVQHDGTHDLGIPHRLPQGVQRFLLTQ